MIKQHPQTRRWVSDKFLADYYEVARCTIWRWVKLQILPPPESFGGNLSRWDFEKIKDAKPRAQTRKTPPLNKAQKKAAEAA